MSCVELDDQQRRRNKLTAREGMYLKKPTSPEQESGAENETADHAASIGPSGIIWLNGKRKLSELSDWPKNPRRLTDAQAAQIAKSIVKFGFVDPIIINTDGTILGGHMRKRVLIVASIAKGSDLVDVRVPSRKLTDEEVAEINIRLNRNTGEFDFDILANQFDEDKLIEWGFESPEFGIEDAKKHNMGDANQDHSFCKTCKRPY